MKKILVDGTFDVLHMGHIALLSYAKSLEGEVTVAIESDKLVKQIRGDNRPINNEMDRVHMLSALKDVDQVTIYDSYEELITLLQDHDVLVKGEEFMYKDIIGSDVIDQVAFCDTVPGYSSTFKLLEILEKVTKEEILNSSNH